MARVLVSDLIQNLKDIEEVKRFLTNSITKIIQQLNGSLEFGPNVRASSADVTFDGNVQKISHGLGIIPQGYIVISQSAAFSVYKAASPDWDDNNIFLNAAANGTAKILVI